MKSLQDDYVCISSEGDFSLWVNKPAYKIYQVDFPFAIQDVRTQEVLNTNQLILRTYIFDPKGDRYVQPLKEEDHYQIICLKTPDL